MVWFKLLLPQDKSKIKHAGEAAPRGPVGSNGYQNHVLRANKVVIPHEKRHLVNLCWFEYGYVFRYLPEQFFDAPGQIKPYVEDHDYFVLYRSERSLKAFPPLPHWEPRYMLNDEGKRLTKRNKVKQDCGHYLVRIKGKHAGVEQGISVPEYANKETNDMCRAMLAWLITKAKNSPYDARISDKIKAHLVGIDFEKLKAKSVFDGNNSTCPFCLKPIEYSLLHEKHIEEAAAIEEVTCTKVNLFHIRPLDYKSLNHLPDNIAWGHARCNTVLGGRVCPRTNQIVENGTPMTICVDGDFGQSPDGHIWMRIQGN